jgi:hypothetical protein
MATYTFTMPKISETPAGFGLFWRYRIDRADSLIIATDGTATQQRTFEVQQLTDAQAAGGKYYVGGHIYVLSAPEVTALTNAGYGAYITTLP